MNVTVRITGCEEINRRLLELDRKLQRKLITKSLRAGAKVVLLVAKANAPVGKTGNLKKSIKIRAARAKDGTKRVIVGVGKKWFTGEAWYGGPLEFGWKSGPRFKGRRADAWWRKFRKKNTERKQVNGKHFIERAYDATEVTAMKTVVSTLQTDTQAAVRELNK